MAGLKPLVGEYSGLAALRRRDGAPSPTRGEPSRKRGASPPLSRLRAGQGRGYRDEVLGWLQVCGRDARGDSPCADGH